MLLSENNESRRDQGLRALGGYRSVNPDRKPDVEGLETVGVGNHCTCTYRLMLTFPPAPHFDAGAEEAYPAHKILTLAHASRARSDVLPFCMEKQMSLSHHQSICGPRRKKRPPVFW